MKNKIESIIEQVCTGKITQISAVKVILETKTDAEKIAIEKHTGGAENAEFYIEALKRIAVEKLGISTQALTELADQIKASGWKKEQ